MAENPIKPKKRILEVEQQGYPTDDPWILMKQRDEAIKKQLENIEVRLSNLQVTWNRILNVANEPDMLPKQGQPTGQGFMPPTEMPTLPTNIKNMPVWDREKLEGKDKPKKKGKFGKRTVVIFFIIVILLIVVMYLRSKGWTSMIPGI